MWQLGNKYLSVHRMLSSKLGAGGYILKIDMVQCTVCGSYDFSELPEKLTKNCLMQLQKSHTDKNYSYRQHSHTEYWLLFSFSTNVGDRSPQAKQYFTHGFPKALCTLRALLKMFAFVLPKRNLHDILELHSVQKANPSFSYLNSKLSDVKSARKMYVPNQVFLRAQIFFFFPLK